MEWGAGAIPLRGGNAPTWINQFLNWYMAILNHMEYREFCCVVSRARHTTKSRTSSKQEAL
jgi:hypothetical protein